MIYSSLLVTPIGLTQLFFVPEYWFPKSTLFNLTTKIGLDIESFLFSFAVGGIAAVLYEELLDEHLKRKRKLVIEGKKLSVFLALILAIFMVVFKLGIKINFMYASIISMVAGTLFILIFRRDLIKESIFGGVLFMVIYFFAFIILNNAIFPNWALTTWNLQNLSGILIIGTPIEELLWALTFGFLWAPIYEELQGYTIKEEEIHKKKK